MNINSDTGSPPRGLWHWFAGGFLLVFVGMLFLVKVTVVHPSGQYAVECNLWSYYMFVLPRAFEPSTLGPASGGTSGLAEAIAQHVIVSSLGGCVAIGVGWWLHKREERICA